MSFLRLKAVKAVSGFHEGPAKGQEGRWTLGTPAPNSLMDLFAEFKCLDMGQRLGRFHYTIPNRIFHAG